MCVAPSFFSAVDKGHMQTALTLSRWGLGRTAENPSVGCVIIDAQGFVVGQGRTADGGRPHAESVALLMAGDRAKGGTAYVTLEPCSHRGKTPPCADALVSSGISRVVVGCIDPDSRVSGRGITHLRNAGIRVDVGCCGLDSVYSTICFFSAVIRQRPWVTVKIATTLDGKIALHTGDSQWITGDTSRTYAHVLRSQNQAILVGSGTVKADNPRLTCRLNGVDHTLARVVVGNVESKDYHVFDGSAPVYHFTNPDRNGDGKVDLHDVMHSLFEKGINRLMIEGGGRIIASLLHKGLIDEIHWIHAPCVIGGDGLPSVGDLGIDAMEKIQNFDGVSRTVLDQDCVSVLRLNTALDFAHHLMNEKGQ